MKKIIAFLMAVVFIMSSIAVIGVYADKPYYYVEYFEDNSYFGVTPRISAGDESTDLYYAPLLTYMPCAKYSINDTFYSYSNCFTVESDLSYTDEYRGIANGLINPYCLRVEESYVVTYVHYPIPVTRTQPLFYYAENPTHNKTNNGIPYAVYYSPSYAVLSVTIYHSVNSSDMGIYYQSAYTSYSYTAVYYFY